MKLYDNSRTVMDENQILSDFQKRSLMCYQRYPHQKDVKYAQYSRAYLDVFEVSNPQKTVVFIHGGYWQWCDKSDFAFIVPNILEQGCNCVLVEYDLAPHSSITKIAAQIKDAFDFIQQQQWLAEEVLLVGHSAGAHLAALQLNHPLISSATLISGIYDLKPIQETHLNVALKLTENEILDCSPICLTQAFYKPYMIMYGALELDELKWQSQKYFQHCQTMNRDFVSLYECAGQNHYSILDYYFKQVFKVN